MNKKPRLLLTLAAAALGATAALSQTAGRPKSGFVGDLESMTRRNRDFRRVVYTGRNLQLVLMNLPPGGEIGEETHPETDQFFRIETGKGEIVINGVVTKLGAGSAALVPAGARHNVKNTGSQPLRLYTLYAPPQHKDGTVQRTRKQAESEEERFDGKTTE